MVIHLGLLNQKWFRPFFSIGAATAKGGIEGCVGGGLVVVMVVEEGGWTSWCSCCSILAYGWGEENGVGFLFFVWMTLEDHLNEFWLICAAFKQVKRGFLLNKFDCKAQP